MPDIVVGSDRSLRITNQNSWAAARDATASTTSLTGMNMVTNRQSSGGKFENARTFFAFDTSAIDAAPSSAKIIVRTNNYHTSNIYIVKVQAGATGDSSTEFVNSDYDLLQGFSPGNTMDGNVVTYSSELNPPPHRSVEITLNAAALLDIALLDEFKIAIVGSRDYTNTEPSVGHQTTAFTTSTSTASQRPRLSYVAGTAGDTPQEKRNKRRRRRSKGARGNGFSVKNVAAAMGGKTVINGFIDD